MIGILVRGLAVGVTETVPGISGSTIAMIVGIYERLIYSLSNLTTNKRREVLPFLIVFGIGMMTGFAISVFLIDFLLSNYRTPTLLFFVGIIVGFLPYLIKDTIQLSNGRFSIKHYSIFGIFLSIVVIGQVLSGLNRIDLDHLLLIDYLFFALIGFLASTALVLPGISGALVLTIFGIYELAVDSLLSLNLPIVMSIGSGVIIGILTMSKVVQYLLAHHKTETYAAMIGLVSGSIYAIFYNLNATFDLMTSFLSIITFFTGVFLIIFLNRLRVS